MFLILSTAAASCLGIILDELFLHYHWNLPTLLLSVYEVQIYNYLIIFYWKNVYTQVLCTVVLKDICM